MLAIIAKYAPNILYLSLLMPIHALNTPRDGCLSAVERAKPSTLLLHEIFALL